MAECSIPVDLLNPGQVFACLGFLEATDILCGNAEGGFDWRDEADTRFHLRAAGDQNPCEAVLEFLAGEDKIQRVAPRDYAESESITPLERTETFMAQKADKTALPIRFGGGNHPVIELGHWADGSGRDKFKLYAGNRSADKIARDMLEGIRQLFDENKDRLINDPFRITPMGGSFNFDPRGAWTAIDAGYSPNTQKHSVMASPVVEFLAAWGLQDARPLMPGNRSREARYAVWKEMLPPMLARAAFIGAIPALTMKRFHFTLDISGKNKIVTFAKQENTL